MAGLVWLILLALVVLLVVANIKIVSQAQAFVVERIGATQWSFVVIAPAKTVVGSPANETDHEIDEEERNLIFKYAIGLGFTTDRANKEIEKSMRGFGGDMELEN